MVSLSIIYNKKDWIIFHHPAISQHKNFVKKLINGNYYINFGRNGQLYL